MPNSIPDDNRELEPSLTKRGRWKLWLTVFALGISPFILGELALRVIGWNDLRPDLFRAYGTGGTLFERHGPFFRTAAVRQPFFQPQQFTANKPRNGLRIFCFGGSTVHGHPYQDDTAFPRWLGLELEARCPERTIEVLNCGGVSYASYRIAPLVREVLDYQPDLIVLATGENEFLEDRTFKVAKELSPIRRSLQEFSSSLRIVKLARRVTARDGVVAGKEPSEVDPRLDSLSGYASYHRDDNWHQEVQSNFDRSLREMANACARRHVPLLLCRLGCDLRDCAPFKSEHRAGLSIEDETRWQKAFDEGTEKQDGQPDLAWDCYARAETIDPNFALLSWRMARLQERKHAPSTALPYYLKARDDDICPLRLVSPNETTLKKVLEDFHLRLLDVSSLLSADCPDQIPGRDRYLDHVHPMIDGHQQIARALANVLQELGLASLKPWTDPERREVYRKQIESLPKSYYSDARRRVDWLESWSRREKFANEMVPIDAEGWLRLGMRDFELAKFPEASLDWKKAVEANPTLKAKLLHRMEDLEAQGRASMAKQMLECIPAP